MRAREEILSRVRSALVASPQGRATDTGVDRGISRDHVHTRELPDRLGLFVERVEGYRATVIRTDGAVSRRRSPRVWSVRAQWSPLIRHATFLQRRGS
jgi:hypothetical protein